MKKSLNLSRNQKHFLTSFVGPLFRKWLFWATESLNPGLPTSRCYTAILARAAPDSRRRTIYAPDRDRILTIKCLPTANAFQTSLPRVCFLIIPGKQEKTYIVHIVTANPCFLVQDLLRVSTDIVVWARVTPNSASDASFVRDRSGSEQGFFFH